MNSDELRKISYDAQRKIAEDFSNHPVCKHILNAMTKAAKAGKYNVCLNLNECLNACKCSDFPLDDARTYFMLHGFNFQRSIVNSHTYITISWAYDD